MDDSVDAGERGSTVVALAGDWHGDAAWAGGRILGIGERGISIILHVGDFGVWPGPSGKKFLRSVDRACERSGVERIFVCPGNHEDWPRLATMWSLPKYQDPETGDPLPLPMSDYVTVLPPGGLFTLPYGDGSDRFRTFVSIGGAVSVDRERRTQGRNWWPEEAIQPEYIERALRNAAPYQVVDVLLAHESSERPFMVPEVDAIVHGGAGDFTWPPAPLADAAVGRQLMTEAFLSLRPSLMVHGHYHVSGEARFAVLDRECRIWSLPNERNAGNIRYLDLSTLDEPDWVRR